MHALKDCRVATSQNIYIQHKNNEHERTYNYTDIFFQRVYACALCTLSTKRVGFMLYAAIAFSFLSSQLYRYGFQNDRAKQLTDRRPDGQTDSW